MGAEHTVGGYVTPHFTFMGKSLFAPCDVDVQLYFRERLMNSKYQVVLAVVAGAVLGAATVQGLHAQAKPKAYQVTELEVLDAEANKAFTQAVRASQSQASGRNLRTAYGKVVAFVGDPPKHVGITEFDSLDQAVAYRNSQGFKDLDPLRNKAIKIIRQYTVEAEN
jgi:uncharacterized protein (DUF1330 family)